MSSGAASNITSILRETRLFPPPPEFAARALIGSVAEYAPNGKYTVYMNTQTLFNARYRIATALGVRESDVRIIQSAVGGGFAGDFSNGVHHTSLTCIEAGSVLRGGEVVLNDES